MSAFDVYPVRFDGYPLRRAEQLLVAYHAGTLTACLDETSRKRRRQSALSDWKRARAVELLTLDPPLPESLVPDADSVSHLLEQVLLPAEDGAGTRVRVLHPSGVHRR